MPYDRVIDVGGRMIRVQIKLTSYLRTNRKSPGYIVSLTNTADKSYGDSIDFFAVYIEPKNVWVFIPVGLAPQKFTCITMNGKFKDCINNWDNLK